MSSEEKKKEEPVVHHVSRQVYLGKRLNAKGKTVHVWAEVTPGTPTQYKDEMWYEKQFYNAVVGGVYDITYANETQFYVRGVRGPRYAEKWGSDDDILQWQLADREVATIVALQGKERANKEDLVHRTLSPIRAAMRKTNYIGRQALITMVLLDLADYYKGDKPAKGGYDDER